MACLSGTWHVLVQLSRYTERLCFVFLFPVRQFINRFPKVVVVAILYRCTYCGTVVSVVNVNSKLTTRLSHFNCYIALECPIDIIILYLVSIFISQSHIS